MTLDAQSRFTVPLARVVGEFAETVFASADEGARLRIAAHELLENAVQYGTSRTASLELSLQEGAGPDFYVVTLKATNETSLERLREVERCMAAMVGTDPTTEFDRLVRVDARGEGGAGLGLARIRAEGDWTIGYAISATQVTVLARTVIPKNGNGPRGVVGSGFACDSKFEAGVLVVRIAGQGGMESAAELNAFLSTVPQRVASLGLNSVRVDLVGLDFLSSSCLKAFTNLVRHAADAEDGLRFDFDLRPDSAWQRRTFAVLQRLAPGIVTLRS